MLRRKCLLDKQQKEKNDKQLIAASALLAGVIVVTMVLKLVNTDLALAALGAIVGLGLMVVALVLW